MDNRNVNFHKRFTTNEQLHKTVLVVPDGKLCTEEIKHRCKVCKDQFFWSFPLIPIKHLISQNKLPQS